MEPSAVQKHHCEVARRNQRELTQELLKLVGAQAVLEQKHQAIDGDQRPGDHRRVARRNRVPDRDHLRPSDWRSRNPGQYLALAAWLWRVIPTFAASRPKPAMTFVNFRDFAGQNSR
jgi:hypothetical protein